MLNPFLVFLAGCAPEISSTEAGLAGAPSDEGCAAATAAIADLTTEATALRLRADLAVIAGENYAAMEGLALRSASRLASKQDRAGAGAEVRERMDLAERIAIDDPALAPSAVGVDDIEFFRPTDAREAVTALDAAVDEVAFVVAEIEGEYAALIAEEAVALAPYPTCRSGADAPRSWSFRGEDGVREAAIENIEEARDFVKESAHVDALSIRVLHAIRTLAVESASETMDDSDRARFHAKFMMLSAEVDRIAAEAEFNGHSFAWSPFGAFDVPTGEDVAREHVAIGLIDLGAAALGVDSASLDLSTASGAAASIDVIDQAISEVGFHRSATAALDDVFAIELERIEAEGQ